jgi:hypothetical protein
MNGRFRIGRFKIGRFKIGRFKIGRFKIGRFRIVRFRIGTSTDDSGTLQWVGLWLWNGRPPFAALYDQVVKLPQDLVQKPYFLLPLVKSSFRPPEMSPY